MADLESAVFGRFQPAEASCTSSIPAPSCSPSSGWWSRCSAPKPTRNRPQRAFGSRRLRRVTHLPEDHREGDGAPLLIIAAIAVILNVFFTQGGEVYVSWGSSPSASAA